MKRPIQFAAILCGCLIASVALAEGKSETGFAFGPRNAWRLTPRVDVGAFWESNSRNTHKNEKSAGGWRVQPSLSLNYKASERGGLSMNAFYTLERGFDSKDAQDSDSYGASLTFHREIAKNLTLTVTGAYSRTEDDEFYGEGWDPANPGLSRIDTDKSERYNANASLGYLGERWRWSVGVGWHRTHYLDRDTDETDSYNVSALIGRAIAAHHYWNFSFSTTFDDASKSSQSYYFMTGLSGSLSGRLSYSTLLGVGVYDYSGTQNDTAVGPNYSASLAYKMNRTFALSLALSSQYKPEYNYSQDKYYVWSHNLTGALNAQWSERWSSRLNVAMVYEEHVGNSGAKDYDRTYIQFSFNTAYKFNTYISAYAGVSWKTDMYSGDTGDTDDFRGDIGLSFVF